MKKIYLGILSALCLGAVNAQTLTQANNAPAVGDNFMTINCNTTGITPGAGGTGVTWNFTSITTTTASTNYTVVTSASTGSAASYPSAGLSVQSGTVNNYYSASASNLSYWGGIQTMGGTQVVLTYSSPAIYAAYPMSLNNTTTSVIGGTVTASGLTGNFTGSCTTTYDGTGTLMLPGNTLTSVSRLMTMQAISFTVPLAGNGTMNQVKWDYYKTATSKYPALTITTSTLQSALGTTTETMVVVNSQFVLGINEASALDNGLSVFPNPSNGNLSLMFENAQSASASYEVVNMIGQTVKRDNLPAGVTSQNINLTELNKGVYFIKLNVGNAVTTKKIVIE